MRLPRFSIAGLMALTALIALDCLATRVGWDSNDVRVALLYFGVLPWLNVLLIGLAVLRGRRRRGEPTAFLVGFEAFGWSVLVFSVTLIFGFTAACASAIEGLDRLLGPLMDVVPPLGFVAAIAIAIAILCFHSSSRPSSGDCSRDGTGCGSSAGNRWGSGREVPPRAVHGAADDGRGGLGGDRLRGSRGHRTPP